MPSSEGRRAEGSNFPLQISRNRGSLSSGHPTRSMHPALSGSPVPEVPSSSLPPLSTLRRADRKDLDALYGLELLCFEPRRRDARRTLEEAFDHGREVWVIECRGKIRASLFLRPVKKTLRIYSIATFPSYRGMGFGRLLLEKAMDQARSGGFDRLSLEADAASESLLSWYERFGFVRHQFLPDFYGAGGDAWRLRLSLPTSEKA